MLTIPLKEEHVLIWWFWWRDLVADMLRYDNKVCWTETRLERSELGSRLSHTFTIENFSRPTKSSPETSDLQQSDIGVGVASDKTYVSVSVKKSLLIGNVQAGTL